MKQHIKFRISVCRSIPPNVVNGLASFFGKDRLQVTGLCCNSQTFSRCMNRSTKEKYWRYTCARMKQQAISMAVRDSDCAMQGWLERGNKRCSCVMPPLRPSYRRRVKKRHRSARPGTRATEMFVLKTNGCGDVCFNPFWNHVWNLFWLIRCFDPFVILRTLSEILSFFICSMFEISVGFCFESFFDSFVIFVCSHYSFFNICSNQLLKHMRNRFFIIFWCSCSVWLQWLALT